MRFRRVRCVDPAAPIATPRSFISDSVPQEFDEALDVALAVVHLLSTGRADSRSCFGSRPKPGQAIEEGIDVLVLNVMPIERFRHARRRRDSSISFFSSLLN